MGIINNIINSAKEASRFKESFFYKSNSDLQEKYNALVKLDKEYPNNENLLEELYIVKKGLEGENEIAYELKKANIGMYILRDVKVKYKDINAQIDYVIITPLYTYYVECKNLVGNITINDKGEFIREYTIKNKKIKKGMYSPLRQVEAQREVLRKIWDSRKNNLQKLFQSNNFNKYRRVLVVIANHDTILNMNYAPKDMKYKVLRSDTLVRQIQYDYNHRDSSEHLYNKKEMEEIADSYIEISNFEIIDYYSYYKNKYCKDLKKDDLKDRLIELRKKRSSEMNMPLYYIFNNEELDNLIKLRPRTIEELKKGKIITDIKIKMHGNKIIEEINR